MTKTFDEICKGILGEMIAPNQPTQPTGQQQPNAATPPKPGTPAPTQGQPPLSDEHTQLLIAAKTPQEVNAAWTKIQQTAKLQPTQAQPTTSAQPATQQQNAAKGV